MLYRHKDFVSDTASVLRSATLFNARCACEHYLMVECASSIADPNDSHHWQLMVAIKSNILRRMDSATPGVRICCVKFIQQVVLVQTPGVVDPRVNIASPPSPCTSVSLIAAPRPKRHLPRPRPSPAPAYAVHEPRGRGTRST